MYSIGTVTVAWHTETVKVLVDLTYLVDQMLPLMEQFEQVQDHDRSLCLRYASIISLTTIAEIHNVLSNTTPESGTKRLESLQMLAQLTEEIPWNLRHLMDRYICVRTILDRLERSTKADRGNAELLGQGDCTGQLAPDVGAS